MNMFDDQTTMARQARKKSGTGIYHEKSDQREPSPFVSICFLNSQPDKEEAADTVLNALLPFLKAASKREPSGEMGKIFIPDS